MVDRRSLVCARILLVAATALAGCSSWKQLEVPPARYLAEKPNTTLRVTTVDRGEVTLKDPHVAGDSLVGRVENRTLALPLASISNPKARYVNVAETAMAVALGSTAAFLILILALP
jgi:hypothetical protein